MGAGGGRVGDLRRRVGRGLDHSHAYHTPTPPPTPTPARAPASRAVPPRDAGWSLPVDSRLPLALPYLYAHHRTDE